MGGVGASVDGGLSRAFSRLGWIGLWLQIGIGTVPIALLIYAALSGGKDGVGTRGGFAPIGWLTIGSLLVLGFTTIWFYRYTLLARRMADPERRPSFRSNSSVEKRPARSCGTRSSKVPTRERRTHVVRIFPNSESCLRLVRALAVETHDAAQHGAPRRPCPTSPLADRFAELDAHNCR